MFRPAALTLLALMAASAPASAQLGSGACQPHRHNEVRCAMRLNIPGGNRLYDVTIAAARNGAEARMQTDTYVSNCGSDGRMIGRGNIANAGSSRVGQFTNERGQASGAVQALFGVCVEVFLLNCVQGGQSVNCQQVLNIGGSRVEIR